MEIEGYLSLDNEVFSVKDLLLSLLEQGITVNKGDGVLQVGTKTIYRKQDIKPSQPTHSSPDSNWKPSLVCPFQSQIAELLQSVNTLRDAMTGKTGLNFQSSPSDARSREKQSKSSSHYDLWSNNSNSSPNSTNERQTSTSSATSSSNYAGLTDRRSKFPFDTSNVTKSKCPNPKCDAPIAPNAIYCNRCGTKVF